MISFLRNLQIEQISFWVGFAAATLFWWLLTALRPYIKKLFQSFVNSFKAAREGAGTSTSQRYRSGILKYAQELHLASPLFSLDEILILPRLMAPPIPEQPGQEPPIEDIVSQLIPYAPDFPELAGFYGARTLTIYQVLQGGANLVLTGHPGSGKTATLAFLASQLARRDPELGDLREHIPIFLHATDIDLTSYDSENPLEIITNMIPCAI